MIPDDLDLRGMGRRTEALRRALGLNKVDFAEPLGLDPSSYAKFVLGNRSMKLVYVYRIYQLYGADPNFLILGDLGGLPPELSAKILRELQHG